MPDPPPVNIDLFEDSLEDRRMRLHDSDLTGYNDDLKPVFDAQRRQLPALGIRRAVGNESQRHLSIIESGDKRKHVLIEFVPLIFQAGERMAGELDEIIVRHTAGMQRAPPRFTAHARAVDDPERPVVLDRWKVLLPNPSIGLYQLIGIEFGMLGSDCSTRVGDGCSEVAPVQECAVEVERHRKRRLESRIGPHVTAHSHRETGTRRGRERQLQVMGLIRRHLLFVLDGETADRLQSLRMRWDPVMASRIPPHVTLVYPEETGDEDLPSEKARGAAGDTAPFSIWFDEVAGSDRGEGGVWFPVVDPSNTWDQLRRRILVPPSKPSGVRPHATVVHPRTSRRSAEALLELGGFRLPGELRMDELLFTETGDSGVEVLSRLPLAGMPPVQMVAGLLSRNQQILLCHRRADRQCFPDCWDLPGGHIDEGEVAAETLVRELDEELGISVETPEGPPWRTLRADGLELSVFLIDRWEGDPRNMAPDEHDTVEWVHTDDLAGLDYADQVYREMLPDALYEIGQPKAPGSSASISYNADPYTRNDGD